MDSHKEAEYSHREAEDSPREAEDSSGEMVFSPSGAADVVVHTQRMETAQPEDNSAADVGKRDILSGCAGLCRKQ